MKGTWGFVLQLKQMKELEQEKDVLLQGLEVVERVREWYHQQIQMVQEHQKYLGKNKANNVSIGFVLGVGLPRHISAWQKLGLVRPQVWKGPMF